MAEHAPTTAPERRMIAISMLRLDGTDVRARGHDKRVIADYAAHMKAGDTFPPVEVFFDGVDFWLGDGQHRVAASKAIGRTEIDAFVQSGGRHQALEAVVECNRHETNGLRLSNADKRSVVEHLLADPTFRKKKDREIAKWLGVSHTHVSNVRHALASKDSVAHLHGWQEWPVADRQAAMRSDEGLRALRDHVLQAPRVHGSERREIAIQLLRRWTDDERFALHDRLEEILDLLREAASFSPTQGALRVRLGGVVHADCIDLPISVYWSTQTGKAFVDCPVYDASGEFAARVKSSEVVGGPKADDYSIVTTPGTGIAMTETSTGREVFRVALSKDGLADVDVSVDTHFGGRRFVATRDALVDGVWLRDQLRGETIER